jgi:ABC-2 type transport system ATP-binding protein
LRGGGEDIEVSADLEPEGTRVQLVVSSRLGAWQLIDWGEARKFHRLVQDRLGVLGDGIGGDRAGHYARTVPSPQAVPTVIAGPAAADPAIEISHLSKTYGPTVAVDDLSLSVTEGEIFGILGPNGAGKTTTIECAIGLRSPDSGSVRVLGLDPGQDREQLHLIVGVQLQASALPAKLKVGEILDLYQSFYPEPSDVDELAKTLGLADKRDEYCRSLSGGQKQRLSIALALIGRPKIAVLDEMTTGLDPRARRDTWQLIEHTRDRGVTIVLVTHSLEEAERLCDRVALVDQGRIVALDSPRGLAQKAAKEKQMRFVPSGPFDDRLLSELPEVAGIEHHDRRVHVTGSGDLVAAVISTLAAAGVTAHDVVLISATLEDAFVSLTGRGLGVAQQPAPPRRGKDSRVSGAHANGPVLPKTAPRSAFGKLVRSEFRLAWRQPVGLGFGLGVPVLLLVIFGSLPFSHEHLKQLGGLTFLETYVPVLIIFGIAALALFSLPTPLATYREQGILRRLSTTPVPPSWILGAQLVVHLSIAAATLVILVVVGTAGFGLRSPASLGGFALAVVLSMMATFGIGLWITGVARNARDAGGIAWLLFFPLMFLAGLWLPRQEFPAALRDVSDATPLGASSEALQHAMQAGFPSAWSLLALAAYAAVFDWLAIRFFRWE